MSIFTLFQIKTSKIRPICGHWRQNEFVTLSKLVSSFKIALWTKFADKNEILMNFFRTLDKIHINISICSKDEEEKNPSPANQFQAKRHQSNTYVFTAAHLVRVSHWMLCDRENSIASISFTFAIPVTLVVDLNLNWTRLAAKRIPMRL